MARRNVFTRHGMSYTDEYKTWIAIRRRCLDPRCKAYAMYGGRGIGIHPDWENDFMAFYREVGPRPAGHSIDRIDNNKGYEPGNCRWATWKEQNRNRRSSRIVEWEGKRYTMAELAEHLGMTYDTFTQRYERFDGDVQAVINATPRCRYVEFNGKSVKLIDLTRQFGVSIQRTKQRMDRGYSLIRALTEPTEVSKYKAKFQRKRTIEMKRRNG